MLFDLRGRGRRRTVQVIYASLAILMGGGLVFFGIGGATNGGLFDAISGSGGNGNVSDIYQKRITRYQAQTAANPKDAAAWAALAKAQVQEASITGYDQTTGTYTAAGKRELARAATSWETYLALKPAKPDGDLANLMVAAYRDGLVEPAKAARALEVVISAKGATSALYAQLSLLAYLAGNTRQSTLAEQRAVDLAPKDRKKLVEAQIAAQRASIDQQRAEAQQQSGSGAAGVPGG
ncbi:unannotated protein [freshwater metagenome]|uniref:Unannotated protein n=1 Tax=freshwater metagenome TaxID=449393 RepID=A0A6J7H232_9ZZZZ|nr:hypothetical protein [Actinomycetota bacterium]